MDGQITIDEVEYWVELEKMFARFCQDLDRIHATAVAIDDQELADTIESARWHVAKCCYIAAQRCGLP